MKKLLLASTFLAALTPAAEARLQLSIGVGASTFTCFDGQLSCDVSGGANNLLTIDQTIGNAFVQITLAQSTFGAANTLQLSSSSITNEGATPITVKLLASDTNFDAPVSFINNSASLTFNDAVGSGQSMLQFWADPANTQGANPSNTPGSLLETVFGTPLTDPDSFSGSNSAAFVSGSPFSMTEGASLALRGGGSITGFNQSMTTGVPEPKTWAMLGVGFALMAFMGLRRSRKDRLATIA
ncbi:MAG TPA: PEP-CTERM sorting domain-containing protein [Casimicrobiaceae bacterium]|jgi:hypothetical protein|nr:PEP-CTERM sorting domain-containing protein [Casimicrobiaceae bacterium]